jgi:hypothetical protein
MLRARTFVPLLSCPVLLLACGSHATPEPQPAQPADKVHAHAPEPEPEPVGFDTITIDDLRSHVTTLASDEFMGRETNRDGARLAADYLADKFRSYGLSVMPGQQQFHVDYELAELGFDATKSTGTLRIGDTERALTAEEDFAPFYFSSPGQWDGDIVFAGYGITAKKLHYDDYEGLNVKNKLVLVLRYWPDEKAKDNAFAKTKHGTFEAKAKNAKKHGAAGMLLVTGPRFHEQADDLRRFSYLSLPLSDKERKQIDERKAKTRGKGKPFLAAHISKGLADELVASTGKSLVDIQTALDSNAAQASDFDLGAAHASFSLEEFADPASVTAHNVIGYLEGSDPALRDEWVIIGAHYDHLGAFEGSGDTIYNGADDNASGTSGMLELAQAFSSLPERPRRSIVFAGFSGEEKGLLGSRALLTQEIISADKVAFMLNLDMIGRNPTDAIEVVGDGYGSGLQDIVTAANDGVGLTLEFGGNDYSPNSDHHPFFMRHVPVLFFFTGLHDDYHQLSDHIDKLAFDRMVQITQLSYGVVDRVAGTETPPDFVHQYPWLGIAIEVREGKSVVSAVDPNSPAAQLGLQVGDVLFALGKRTLGSDEDLATAFDELTPGVKIVLTAIRGEDDVSVQIERKKTGFLGVYPRGVDDETRTKHGLAADEGVLLGEVTPGGPAHKAGLKKGDIIVTMDGAPISDRTLTLRLSRIGAGAKVTIVIIRDDARETLPLTLGTRPKRR